MKYLLKYKTWIAVIVIVLFSIYLIKVFGRKKSVDDGNSTFLKVAAEAIGTADLTETIAVTGGFEALTSVEVIPEIPGQLEQLRLPDGTLVDVGVAVKKGQVIAVIDHDVYLAQLAECQAALEASKVALVDAEREKKRIIRLFEGGKRNVLSGYLKAAQQQSRVETRL